MKENPLIIHVHYNGQKQVCALKDNLEIGQVATIHLHDAPGECRICPNGHCHAQNITISRIDEQTIFVALEPMPLQNYHCDIKTLPQHPDTIH